MKGSLNEGTSYAALSIGRGNAKTALSAGLALGALLGEWDQQPRREIPMAARTRDQARIAWEFAVGFSRSLPEDIQRQLIFRRSPRLEIEYEGDGGGHLIRAIAGVERPSPDFQEAYEIQRTIAAALRSAAEQAWIKVESL